MSTDATSEPQPTSQRFSAQQAMPAAANARAPYGGDGEEVYVPYDEGNTPAADRDTRRAYSDPGYVQSRDQALSIIPRTSWLDSVDRYAGSLAIGIFLATAGSIGAVGLFSLPTLVGLAAGLLVTAWGINSHYKSRRLSAPVDIRRGEEMTIASAKVHAKEQAKELAAVLDERFERKRPETQHYREHAPLSQGWSHRAAHSSPPSANDRGM